MKIRGLNPVYNGPYIVLDRTEKYFKIDLNTRVDNVSIDRLKAAHTDEEILKANTSSTSLIPLTPTTLRSSARGMENKKIPIPSSSINKRFPVDEEIFDHSLSPGPQQSDESRDPTREQRRKSQIPVLVPRPQKRISIVNEPCILTRQGRKIRKPKRYS